MKKKAENQTQIILRPSPEIQLHGLEIVPKSKSSKIPVAILFHGYTSNYRRLAYIANLFITNEIAVLLMNLRGHGKSSGRQNDISCMQNDLDTIIDYVHSKEYFDKERLILVGISLGALIALTAGYNNTNIGYIVALAAISSPTTLLDGMTRFRRWRWKQIGRLGGLNIKKMIGKPQFSPCIQPQLNENTKKILLLHCKNDALVNESNFWINIAAFKLDKNNYSLFSRGTHSFFLIKQRVVETILKWLVESGIYKAE